MKVGGKSNEITAMPKLLQLMDIRGSVVTSLHCQKEIASEVIRQGGDYVLYLQSDYVLALKSNQPSDPPPFLWTPYAACLTAINSS